MMPCKRKTDPIFLQYIWDALDACFNLSLPPNLDNIFNHIVKERDIKVTIEKVESELLNCIDDGCVTLLHNKEYLKQQIQTVSVLDHDCYCYECHGSNCNFYCEICYRSFHYNCLDKADDSITSNLIFPPTTAVPRFRREMRNCPICIKSQYFDDHSCMEEDLKSILLNALNNIKNKSCWKLLTHIGYVNDPARNSYLLAKEINTKIIGRRMRLDKGDCEASTYGPLKCYRNRNELLLDLDHLVHNSAVIYGIKNHMCQTAKQIRCTLHKEMKESSLCIDCYVNYGKAGKSIVTPCRNDHKIIWFQHNGWSFWPCKVLYDNQEGYEVVRFGGRHERAFVPRDRGHDFVFSATEMGLRITPALKKALLEVDEYLANKRLQEHMSKSGLSSYQTATSSHSSDKKHRKNKLEKTKSLQPMKSFMSQPKKPEVQVKRRDSLKTTFSKSFLSETDSNESSSDNDEESNRSLTQNITIKKTVCRERSSSLSSLTMSESEMNKSPVRKVEPKTSRGLVLRIKPLPPPPSSICNEQEDLELTIESSTWSGVNKNSVISPVTSSSTISKVSSNCRRQIKEEINEEQDPIPNSKSTLNDDRKTYDSNYTSITIPCSRKKQKSDSNKSLERTVNNLKRKSDYTQSDKERRNQRKSAKTINKNHPKIYSSSSSDNSEDETSNTSSSLSPSSQTSTSNRFHPCFESNYKKLDPDTPNNLTPKNEGSDISDKRVKTMLSPDKIILNRKNFNSDYSSLSGSATPITSIDSGLGSASGRLHKSNSPEKWSNPQFQASYGVGNYSVSSSLSSQHPSTNTITSSLQNSSHLHQIAVNSVSPAALSSSSSSGLGSCYLSDANAKSVDVSPGDGYRQLSHNQRIPSMTASSSTGSLGKHPTIVPNLDPSFIKAIEDRVAAMFQERLTSLTLERDMMRDRNSLLEKELQTLQKKHEEEFKKIKRKCWCVVCLAEANYHCCAAISYCSQECQYQHWKSDHSKVCKRINQ